MCECRVDTVRSIWELPAGVLARFFELLAEAQDRGEPKDFPRQPEGERGPGAASSPATAGSASLAARSDDDCPTRPRRRDLVRQIGGLIDQDTTSAAVPATLEKIVGNLDRLHPVTQVDRHQGFAANLHAPPSRCCGRRL
jgi:hypothetical protein